MSYRGHLLYGKVLLLCREAVCVFYSSSRLGKNLLRLIYVFLGYFFSCRVILMATNSFAVLAAILVARVLFEVHSIHTIYAICSSNTGTSSLHPGSCSFEANVSDYDILASEFKLQSLYCILFQTKSLEKCMNPFISPCKWVYSNQNHLSHWNHQFSIICVL